MTSTKSVVLRNKKKYEINKSRKSFIKTCIKKFIFAVEKKNCSEAQKLFVVAQSNIARAVTKKLLKKNNASRKISSLAAKLKTLLKNFDLKKDVSDYKKLDSKNNLI